MELWNIVTWSLCPRPVGSRRLRMPRPSRGLCVVRKVRGKRAEQERSDGLRAGRRVEQSDCFCEDEQRACSRSHCARASAHYAQASEWSGHRWPTRAVAEHQRSDCHFTSAMAFGVWIISWVESGENRGPVLNIRNFQEYHFWQLQGNPNSKKWIFLGNLIINLVVKWNLILIFAISMYSQNKLNRIWIFQGNFYWEFKQLLVLKKIRLGNCKLYYDEKSMFFQFVWIQTYKNWKTNAFFVKSGTKPCNSEVELRIKPQALAGERSERMPRPSRASCAFRKWRGKRAKQERSDGLRAGRWAERESYLAAKANSDLWSEATACERARIMRKRASGVAIDGQREQWLNPGWAIVTWRRTGGSLRY